MKIPFLPILLIALSPVAALTAETTGSAELTITDTVLRPAEKVPPLGANSWGRCGAVEWAANNFVHNSGNEPVNWRRMHRVTQCGENWFEIEVGTSWFDLYGNGFLSGAGVRIYRLVNKDGKPLPLTPGTPGYIDISKADHVLFVGKGRILPEGSPGFPDGGWVASKYSTVHPFSMLSPDETTCTDTSGPVNGRTYWYTVVAIGPGDTESNPSNETSATPKVRPA